MFGQRGRNFSLTDCSKFMYTSIYCYRFSGIRNDKRYLFHSSFLLDFLKFSGCDSEGSQPSGVVVRISGA